MGIHLTFRCDFEGCGARAEGTDQLRYELRPFGDLPLRQNAFQRLVEIKGIDDVAPPGWAARGGSRNETYCPECWAKILGVKEAG